MRSLATTILAVAAVFLPALSTVGHLDTQLPTSLGDQEIVVTGHDEFDPVLHVEPPTGVVVVHCPECVLDKRQSGSRVEASPGLVRNRAAGRFQLEESSIWTRELTPSCSPRAPPFA